MYYKNFIGPPSVVICKNLGIHYDSQMKWLVDVDFYVRFLNTYPSFAFTKEPLINVGYSSDQVSEAVFKDKTVFVKENLMILRKLPHKILNKVWNYDYTWRMIRNFKIGSRRELEELFPAGASNLPQHHIDILNFQRLIPFSLLKIGVVSKLFMIASYFRSFYLRNKT